MHTFRLTTEVERKQNVKMTGEILAEVVERLTPRGSNCKLLVTVQNYT